VLKLRVTSMYSIATDDPFNALPRAGEHLLIDKTTRRR